MRLEGKKALITGASRGIGRAIAECFMAEGASVWGLGTKRTPELENFIDASGGRLRWLSADVGNPAAIEAAIEAAVKEADGFDILVNNAGITKDGLSFRMPLSDWQRVLDINLTGAFLVARTVARDMIRRRSGSIINLSSVVGQHGNAGQCNYAASKAGLIALSKSLAQETASRGIRVNAIAPGYIQTDMTEGLQAAVKEKLQERIPLKRLGQAADVAAVALFLASDDSAYITGQTIAVDGGMFI